VVGGVRRLAGLGGCLVVGRWWTGWDVKGCVGSGFGGVAKGFVDLAGASQGVQDDGEFAGDGDDGDAFGFLAQVRQWDG